MVNSLRIIIEIQNFSTNNKLYDANILKKKQRKNESFYSITACKKESMQIIFVSNKQQFRSPQIRLTRVSDKKFFIDEWRISTSTFCSNFFSLFQELLFFIGCFQFQRQWQIQGGISPPKMDNKLEKMAFFTKFLEHLSKKKRDQQFEEFLNFPHSKWYSKSTPASRLI